MRLEGEEVARGELWSFRREVEVLGRCCGGKVPKSCSRVGLRRLGCGFWGLDGWRGRGEGQSGGVKRLRGKLRKFLSNFAGELRS